MPLPETSPLDARRKRAAFRAWHRGIKEMDLLLGRFADAHVGAMDEATLSQFEMLMAIADGDLLKWFTGESGVPAEHDTALFQDICTFHAIERR